jgi:hypothetical protein
MDICYFSHEISREMVDLPGDIEAFTREMLD